METRPHNLTVASRLGAAIIASGVMVFGCLDSRLPVCKTNADCTPKAGQVVAGPICYDLRCVQCRYDKDCDVGELCNSAHECKRISAAVEEEPEQTSSETGWEPSNWKECARECKTPKCIEECGEKFEVDPQTKQP